MSEVLVGRVKFFRSEKGWGAIVADALPHDVWVHFSHIEADGYRSLRDRFAGVHKYPEIVDSGGTTR